MNAPARILAVDDSRTMRGMVERALRAQGYEVRLAADAQQALAALQDGPVDLIVTDVNMPGLDGIGFVRKLRADARLAATPILVLTTESDPEMQAAGQAAGATAWMVKPFQAATLCEVVARLLGTGPGTAPGAE